MTTGNPKPEMVPVTSSQISKIGYDEETQTLAVEFKAKGGSGSLYHYSDVSPETHAAFMKAESKGTHLGKHIKGKHPFKKIVQEAPGGKPMF